MNLREYYSDIVRQYPEHITKLQFCEICGICKSTAYQLLKSDRISYEKCVDRLLHYYKIPLIEALQYKYDKEVEGVLIVLNGRTRRPLWIGGFMAEKRKLNKRSFSQKSEKGKSAS